MSAASDFARLGQLPVAAAIQYMRTRADLTVTHNWQDLWEDEHARQFTVSRLARLDLLQALHDGITRSVAGDLNRKDWMQSAERLLANAGWWGEKQVLDPSTGERVKTVFDPARLALIFDVNTRQAYAAGQWQRLQAAKHTHPWLRYVTRDDGRVRPQHQAWHNVTLPVDDAFWQTHFPPNGWRCRCRVAPVSRKTYEQGKAPDGQPLKKQPPPQALIEHVNKRTGVITHTPFGIDPGFAYNSGEAASKALQDLMQTRLKMAKKELANAARQAGMTPPDIAREVPGQDNWQSLGLPDLRQMRPRGETPQMLKAGESLGEAVSILRGALGVPIGAAREVHTPVGKVVILDELLVHVVQKRADGRERYANFVLPTLMSPDEVWNTAYDDGAKRRRFIKLFSNSNYDITTVVRQEPNGSIFWNAIIRARKGMNSLRAGELMYTADGAR